MSDRIPPRPIRPPTGPTASTGSTAQSTSSTSTSSASSTAWSTRIAPGVPTQPWTAQPATGATAPSTPVGDSRRRRTLGYAEEAPGRVPDAPWWRRLGHEPPRPLPGCPEPDCDAVPHATDVYCPVHATYLPHAALGTGKVRVVVANVLRFVLIGAFALAVHLGTDLPVLLLALTVVLGMLVIPLRAYPTTRRVAAVAWIAVALVSVYLTRIPTGDDPQVRQWLGTVLLWSAGLVLFLYLGGVAVAYGYQPAVSAHRNRAAGRPPRDVRAVGRRSPGVGAGVVASALTGGVVAAALLGTLGLVPSAWQVRPPDFVRSWLVLAVLAAPFGAAFLGVLIGWMHSSSGVVRPVAPLFGLPRRPARLTWGLRVRAVRSRGSATPIARVAVTVAESAYRMARAVVGAVRGMCNVLRATAYGMAVTAAVLALGVHRWLVRTRRRLARVLVCAARAYADAVGFAVTATGTAVRVILLPLAGLAVAAWTAEPVAGGLSAYLADDSWGELGTAMAAVGAAVIAVPGVWVLLVGGDHEANLKSAGRNLRESITHVLMLVALGGWVLGLPHVFGYGSVQLGPITYGLTAVLAVLGLSQFREPRRPKPKDPPRPKRPPGRRR